MSSGRFAVPLEIEFNPSGGLTMLLVVAHGAAAGVIWWLPMSYWVQGAGSLVLTGHLVWSVGQYARGWWRRSIRAIRWDEEGRWHLWTRDGRLLSGRLCGDSILHPQLVLLNFTLGPWGRRSVVLLPREIDPVTFHRLRVRLRVEGRVAPGAEGRVRKEVAEGR